MEKTISLTKVNKFYGKKQVLNQIDLDLKPGEIHCLLGPSGAGKTTTIECLLGITKIQSGTVKILGTQMPNRQILSQVGYMGQSAALYEELSAIDNLKFFADLKGISKKDFQHEIQEKIKIVGLENELKTKVKNFSGGMKTRLSLAITLLDNPPVLILDEPTVGIDPQLRIDIWKELRRLADNGTTIIMTTHIMDEAEKSDIVSLIMNGIVFEEGSPAELKQKFNAASIEEVFLKAEDLANETK